MTSDDTPDGATIDGWSCPAPLRDQPNIVMGHGGGGKLSAELIQHLFLPAFNNEHLEDLGDAAVVELPAGRIAMSTDSFVIRPRVFPGGDIGELAINGTVNDVAMTGATPLYVSVAMILEEGMPIDELAAITQSMAKAADQAGVQLVTGDTKVVDRGHGDGVYVNTTGLGIIRDGIDIRPQNVGPGDVILVNGTIGDHGMAIMSVREGLEFETTIESDTAALNHLVAALLDAAIDVRALRDPTRGGLAATLNEFAEAAQVGVVVEELRLPVKREVASACEMLGMDPFYVANEGKVVVVVPAEQADKALEVMQAHELGTDATRIGEIVANHPGVVVAKTAIGATRVVDTQVGEQLPRIC
ncbi:MAG: hydrogenase expression/formation protein HypE [Acidimicrobiia bacterium]|nr:hydrogenase expression/formation protein HypE [Acidimicrobiia bacterium]